MHFTNLTKALVLLIILGSGLFITITWFQLLKADDSQSEETEDKSKQRSIPVHATVAEPAPLSDTLEVTGTVIPEQQVDLKAEASGRVTSIPLEEGKRVNKGDLLLEINNAELQAQLKQTKQQKELVKQRLDRKAKLLAQKGISQQSYDETKTEFESLKAEIELLKARIAKTTIRAPFDGTLGLKNVSVGSYVSPSSQVIKIVKSQPVKLEFSIPGKYAPLVETGKSVSFRPDGTDTLLSTKIHAIEPAIDQNTRKLRIRARYPNKNQMLSPGSFVNVYLRLTTDPDALVIPTIAVIPELDGKKIYVYRNGKSYPRPVKTGQRTGTHVQVVEGLRPGDTVITKGIQKIRKGSDVAIRAMQH